MGGSAGRQSVGAVSSDPPCIACHEETRLGPHHQHGLDLFDPRRRRPNRLRDDQDRHPRHDRAVAIETTTSGITCNALCPGTLPTPAIQGKIASIAAAEGRTIDEATRDYLAARQPTGRFVAMEGVGAMAVFLCSQAAQDITGATLPIDGGWSIA